MKTQYESHKENGNFGSGSMLSLQSMTTESHKENGNGRTTGLTANTVMESHKENGNERPSA